MRCRYLFPLMFAFAAIMICRSDVLDRTAAVVNGHVILLSEWNDELNFECLASGRKLVDITPEQRKAALDHLIDQQLLREQMRTTGVKPVPAEEVQEQIESLKVDCLREHPDESWEPTVLKYQLTNTFIRAHVNEELEQLQFIDARFRPSAQISADEIEKYYRDRLVPKLPARDPVSLAEATPKIREILIQEKITLSLTSWLQVLRTQAQIRFLPIYETPDSRQSQAAAP